MIALAIALREHTALHEFGLIDCARNGNGNGRVEAVQGTTLGPVL
jgi:hypothetical protein